MHITPSETLESCVRLVLSIFLIMLAIIVDLRSGFILVWFPPIVVSLSPYTAVLPQPHHEEDWTRLQRQRSLFRPKRYLIDGTYPELSRDKDGDFSFQWCNPLFSPMVSNQSFFVFNQSWRRQLSGICFSVSRGREWQAGLLNFPSLSWLTPTGPPCDQRDPNVYWLVDQPWWDVILLCLSQVTKYLLLLFSSQSSASGSKGETLVQGFTHTGMMLGALHILDVYGMRSCLHSLIDNRYDIKVVP